MTKHIGIEERLEDVYITLRAGERTGRHSDFVLARDARNNLDFLARSIKAQTAEVERLQTIVDTLPKTADGEPAYTGRKVYLKNTYGGKGEFTLCAAPYIDGVGLTGRLELFPLLALDVYSSHEAREAAEAAQEETKHA